jgi:RNA polymerase sigma-70 factor, ECF subfamily
MTGRGCRPMAVSLTRGSSRRSLVEGPNSRRCGPKVVMAAHPPGRIALAPEDEHALLAALRAHDEGAFAALVQQHGPAMLRVAASFVPTAAVAEEVVQDTWLAVLHGLDGFRGEASLRTWIFRILVNRARSSGVRERRMIPFSASVRPEQGAAAAVDPDRFLPVGHRWAGHWASPPTPWDERPETWTDAVETFEVVHTALAGLPDQQRAVVELRDIQGWPSEEVCYALDVSRANQRVLLHRGRSQLRAALEAYLGDDGAAM